LDLRGKKNRRLKERTQSKGLNLYRYVKDYEKRTFSMQGGDKKAYSILIGIIKENRPLVKRNTSNNNIKNIR
jgi:hypothetical protein